MTSTKKIDTTCPNCQKKDTWKSENQFRPFCSERCKLIDLGAWADEQHRIAGDDEDKLSSSDEEDA
jgi:endogenous inhibitor of DNA gyrase (YacG/DUF329 family)